VESKIESAFRCLILMPSRTIIIFETSKLCVRKYQSTQVLKNKLLQVTRTLHQRNVTCQNNTCQDFPREMKSQNRYFQIYFEKKPTEIIKHLFQIPCKNILKTRVQLSLSVIFPVLPENDYLKKGM
jgi:hypothetical protein